MLKFVNLILSVFILFSVANATADTYKFRETDFAPFPLSQAHEDVLEGSWLAPNDTKIRVVKLDEGLSSSKTWYIIYFTSDDAVSKEIFGFAYQEEGYDSYNLLYWDSDGQMKKIDLGVYFSTKKSVPPQAAPDETHPTNCRMLTFMIELEGVEYIRQACFLAD